MIYTGVIENVDDPLKLGRCQVRVFGVHGELLSDIPTEDLPWATVVTPLSASTSGIGISPSGYLPGSTVFVIFQDGDSKQIPIILGAFTGIPTTKTPVNTKLDNDKNKLFSEEVTEEIVQEVEAQPSVDEILPEAPPQTGTGDWYTDIPRTAPPGSNGNVAGIIAVIEECKRRKIKERRVVATILGIVGGECLWKPVTEKFTYSSAKRLTEVFGVFKRNPDLAPRYVNNPKELPEFLYGKDSTKGRELGNTEPGDGARYIGRGFIQLTGKANYTSIGKAINVDLVKNPDLLVSDVTISAKAAVEFILSRTKAAQDSPGYFDAANKAVNAADPNKAKKKAYYEFFLGQGPGSIASTENTPQISTQSPASFDILTDNSNGGFGFSDPSGTYPKFLKEPDTNRLARSQKISETIVADKKSNKVTGIQTVNIDWEEPDPAYAATYPNNRVLETASGHVIEIDDTNGSERIHVYHKSGTYIEMDSAGNYTTRIKGTKYEIVDRNSYLYISGACNVTIGGDANLEVSGSVYGVVHGSAILGISEDLDVKASNIILDASDSFEVKSSTIKFTASSTVDVSAGGNLNTDASKIYLNSGKSSKSGGSKIPKPSNTKVNFFDDIKPQGKITEIEQSFETSDDGDPDEFQRRLIAAGVATEEELAARPIEGDKYMSVTTNKDLIPADCAKIASLPSIPEKLKLSPNFTLDQVSSNAAASKYKTVAQNGLTREEIVCNLQAVCLNVLETVKREYPGMLVTSGFRTGSGKSQHLRGEAVDIQFPGVSKSEYYVIAKKLVDVLPVFDQLLLEYKNYGSKMPWIHISLKRTGANRRQVLTLWNDATYAQGLVDLGNK